MRRRALPLAALLLAAVALASATLAGQSAPDASRVARGKYLVTIMYCTDCHTPWKDGPDGPAPDMTRMLSGHPQDLAMPPAPDHGRSL